jgi:hypothetical protein
MSTEGNKLSLIEKGIRKGRKIAAAGLKAPGIKTDEATGEQTSYLSYVSQAYRDIQIPCTQEIFQRATNRRSRKDASTGLHHLTGRRFLLTADADGKAIGLDVLFLMDGQYRARVQSTDPDRTDYEFEYDHKSGSYTMLAGPAEGSDAETARIISALDKREDIRAGEEYEGVGYISGVNGNRFTFAYTA